MVISELSCYFDANSDGSVLRFFGRGPLLLRKRVGRTEMVARREGEFERLQLATLVNLLECSLRSQLTSY